MSPTLKAAIFQTKMSNIKSKCTFDKRYFSLKKLLLSFSQSEKNDRKYKPAIPKNLFGYK